MIMNTSMRFPRLQLHLRFQLQFSSGEWVGVEGTGEGGPFCLPTQQPIALSPSLFLSIHLPFCQSTEMIMSCWYPSRPSKSPGNECYSPFDQLQKNKGNTRSSCVSNVHLYFPHSFSHLSGSFNFLLSFRRSWCPPIPWDQWLCRIQYVYLSLYLFHYYFGYGFQLRVGNFSVLSKPYPVPFLHSHRSI